MSQPYPNPEYQPENPQPVIEQHSSGDLLGGQQATIGNNNNQFQDNSTNYNFYNFYYNELQDGDLEPLTLKGKVLGYFGVFIALVLTLIFWFFFGLFVDFPFPFRQALSLLFSCFRGKVGSKVNSLQKQLQLKDTDSLSIERLNEIDFQARLYLEVLESLGKDKVRNHERLSKTIEILRQKRILLQGKIKPYQPKNYKAVSEAQDFFESFVLNQSEGDFVQIEMILSELILSTKNDYPSETIARDTLRKLSKEVARKSEEISSSKLGLLYRIEALLHEMSNKEISNRNYDNHLLNLQKTIDNYARTDRIQKSDLIKAKEISKDLQGKEIIANEKINKLKQAIQQKQAYIDELKCQIHQYSRMRILEGDYIGNLSDPSSKYHFDRKCNHWKMLVGEYILCLDPSRNIESSKTPDFFFGKLGECKDCAKSRNR